MIPRVAAFKPLLTACGLLVVVAGGAELALRLRETGHSVTGPADPFVEPCPRTHHRLRPLQRFLVSSPGSEKPIEIAVNCDGLRGPEVAVPKPPGTFRVLCLGDETLLAPHLPEESTLPSRLQAMLQTRTSLKVEVLNGGIPGGCPLLSWLRLRHGLIGLQPDLVVIHFDMTDPADDRRYRRWTRLGQSGLPLACHHPSLALETKRRSWWQDLRITAELSHRLSSFGPAVPEPFLSLDDPAASTAWLRENPLDWKMYAEQSLAPLEPVREATEALGGQLLVATCPQPWQVSSDASSGPGVREAFGVAPGAEFTGRAPFEAILAFTEARGIACCDASTAFRSDAQPARLFLESAAVLSAAGEDLYGRVLGDFIAARVQVFGGTIPSPPELLTPGVDPRAPAPPGVTVTSGR